MVVALPSEGIAEVMRGDYLFEVYNKLGSFNRIPGYNSFQEDPYIGSIGYIMGLRNATPADIAEIAKEILKERG